MRTPVGEPIDEAWMRRALALARRGYGRTSPNPMVGAVLVAGGRLLGEGWHRQAGRPHAEIEALSDARRRGLDPTGATLYVTLEPCCTHGRTPPCTDAIRAARIGRVVVAATDPNPRHAGRGLKLLRADGIEVVVGVLGAVARELNEAFNHWIVHGTPFVTVKAAMSLDGKIATTARESRWITGPAARAIGMRLRRGADAILVGVNTVRADDPNLTLRGRAPGRTERGLRRIILDSRARTPPDARLVTDASAALTTVVVTARAARSRVAALARRVRVVEAPALEAGRIDLHWLMRALGEEGVTHLLVEGGGEVQGAFLAGRLAHRVAFFYGPLVLGGRTARKAVAGIGATAPGETLSLRRLRWRRAGEDLYLTARCDSRIED